MTQQTEQTYQSFLVRCWRFELRVVPAEPQKHRFGDLGQLIDFLSAKLAALAASRNRDSDKEDNELRTKDEISSR